MQILKDTNQQFKIVNQTDFSNCGCPTPSNSDRVNEDVILTDGSIKIDGKKIKFTQFDQNIVDVAIREKISIPAPCYRSKRSQGCCGACVIEINGKKKYACNTVPENKMNIVLDRADLKEIRKQKLKEYKEGIKSGNPCECPESGTSSCCG
jgi:predicted molibdopterin-dependent oxidoreductase YjgC